MRIVRACLLIALSLIPMAWAHASEPAMNLTELKRQCITYHDSGRYLADITAIDAEAEQWIVDHAQTTRAAIVLDIDETSISNWGYEKRYDFGFEPDSFVAFCRDTPAMPIEPTRALAEHAKRLHVAVFFITGRREGMRAITESDLTEAGYRDWDGLDLAPAGYHEPSISVYKTAARKRVTERGFHIIANVGDQESDLAGGYADKSFKLPNPFYLVR